MNVQMLEECLCSERAEYVCVRVTWNILRVTVFAYVAPEWLRLMNKHTHSVLTLAFPQFLPPFFDVQGYELQFSPINKLSL